MTPENLARYLSGNGSPADQAAVENWAESDPANSAELLRLRTVWTLSLSPPGDWNVDRAWNRVRPQLANDPPEAALFRRPAAWFALAATAVLAVGAAWQATRSRSTVYQTTVGQQQQIRLADGSTVDLAPESRLEVGNGYGQTARAVTLAGRGLFEVRHDAGRPFRVTAGGATIEDLGTAFEVAARGSATVHVVVITGSVAVRSRGMVSAVTLQARDVATVRTNTPPVVSRAVSIEDLTSWRRGTLVFDGATVAEVVEELERWYSVRFEIATPALADRHLSVTFRTTDRIEDALDVITTSLPGTMAQRRGSTIVISSAPPR